MCPIPRLTQGRKQLSNASINYHPIIGIVVLVSLFFQPALGILHHRRFKRQGRRQIWSHLHLFLGRASIVLGMVNGGLGLHVSGASASLKTAYTVVAAVMGALWLLCALAAELRRCRARRRPAVPPPPPQGDPVLGSDDDDGVHERASPVVEPKL